MWVFPSRSEARRAGVQRSNQTVPTRSKRVSARDVIHLFLLGAVIEQLLESDAVGGFVQSLLQLLPRPAQFRRTLPVAQGRRIKDLPVHRAQDVAQRDLGRRTRQ